MHGAGKSVPALVAVHNSNCRLNEMKAEILTLRRDVTCLQAAVFDPSRDRTPPGSHRGIVVAEMELRLKQFMEESGRKFDLLEQNHISKVKVFRGNLETMLEERAELLNRVDIIERLVKEDERQYDEKMMDLNSRLQLVEGIVHTKMPTLCDCAVDDSQGVESSSVLSPCLSLDILDDCDGSEEQDTQISTLLACLNDLDSPTSVGNKINFDELSQVDSPKCDGGAMERGQAQTLADYTCSVVDPFDSSRDQPLFGVEQDICTPKKPSSCLSIELYEDASESTICEVLYDLACVTSPSPSSIPATMLSELREAEFKQATEQEVFHRSPKIESPMSSKQSFGQPPNAIQPIFLRKLTTPQKVFSRGVPAVCRGSACSVDCGGRTWRSGSGSITSAETPVQGNGLCLSWSPHVSSKALGLSPSRQKQQSRISNLDTSTPSRGSRNHLNFHLVFPEMYTRKHII